MREWTITIKTAPLINFPTFNMIINLKNPPAIIRLIMIP